MEFNDIFTLEIDGIAETINDYAVENFIRSYSTQLKDMKLPDDQEKVKIIIERLLEWYRENITLIDNSSFVNNKHEHHKSMRLLLEFQQKLN